MKVSTIEKTTYSQSTSPCRRRQLSGASPGELQSRQTLIVGDVSDAESASFYSRSASETPPTGTLQFSWALASSAGVTPASTQYPVPGT